MHCFYYLLPLVAEGHFTTAVGSLGGGSTNSPDVAHGGGHGTQDTDRQVLDLAADLSRIEEALSNAVQPRKHKYVTVQKYKIKHYLANTLQTAFMHTKYIF